ncbi:unnamed protein product, partial [Owenia fusiformis]
DARINIITTFPILKSSHDISSHGFLNTSMERFENRQMDFIRTLSLNMKHQCVEKIHLLVENLDVEMYLKSLETSLFKALDIDTMIRFHKLPGFPTYKDYAQYANEHLMFKNISIMNADISLGDGFNLIKEEYLVEHKVAYCLTRHSTTLANCTSDVNFCTMAYQGSHDAHVMFMDTAFDKWSLNFLNYPINLLGVENLFMYTITNRLKKHGLNPCSILKTHHNHCSRLRSGDTVNEKKRINRGKNATYSKLIGYSKKLF